MGIGDVVCLTLYLVTEFVNYLLMYVLVFQMPINKKKRNWIFALALTFGIHFTVASMFTMYDAMGTTFITMLVIPFFLVTGSLKKRFGLYLFVFVAPSSVSCCVAFLLALLCHISVAEAQLHPGILLGSQCVPIILLLALYFCFVRRGKNITPVYVGRAQLIFYGVGAICIWWMIGGMQASCKYDLPNRVIMVTGSVTSIACVIFVFLILWQGIVARREIQLKEQLHMNEQVMKLQEEHFRQIILQDEKVRKLRHNMRAHMMVLREYCENGEYEKLTEYISHMTDDGVSAVKSYTGNQGVDAVLNNLVEGASGEGIVVDVRGAMLLEDRLTTFEMCTILFNLMQNAIEACRRIPTDRQRNIRLEMLVYDGKQYLCIGNATRERVQIRQGTLQTTKEEKSEHGIGTKNVEEIIRKHDGTIEYRAEENWFEVQILV